MTRPAYSDPEFRRAATAYEITALAEESGCPPDPACSRHVLYRLDVDLSHDPEPPRPAVARWGTSGGCGVVAPVAAWRNVFTSTAQVDNL